MKPKRPEIFAVVLKGSVVLSTFLLSIGIASAQPVKTLYFRSNSHRSDFESGAAGTGAIARTKACSRASSG